MLPQISLSCLIGLVAVVGGCASPHDGITQYGAMRAVMREGSVEPRASLCDAASKPHMYGIGTLAGLGGELTIDDSAVWVTRHVDGKAVTTGPACVGADQATLLTVGEIASPTRVALSGPLGGAELERAIRDAALAGASTATPKPFMFFIDATASSLNAHVIDGTCLHADPNAQGLKIALTEPTQVRIVGLYAENQAGVLTHHGSSVHMHAIFKYDGKTITAHVDSVTLAAGAQLGLERR